jgi:hypothetical protein
MVGINQIVLPTVGKVGLYRDQPSLPFAGAERLHIEAGQAAEYEAVVAFVKRNRCTALYGYPNIDSLYLWASIDPPRPSPPGVWATALDEGTQNRILAQLRREPRLCVFHDEAQAADWLGDRPRPETALVRYLFDDFEKVGEAGRFELFLPKEQFPTRRE